jgi:hypothetical protein
MQVRWIDGRLAAKTRHDALRAIGINALNQLYLNVFQECDGHTVDPDVLE